MILASPGKPKGPLKVEDVTKSGCKVKWEKPEDDGGKPITGYAVEKLDKATGRWVPVGRTADTEMDIKGLQEGHEYQFRVKAINDEGESEPLECDRSIIAKNPYGLFTTDYAKCLLFYNLLFFVTILFAILCYLYFFNCIIRLIT